VWLEPVSELEGFWLEVGGLPDGELAPAAARLLPVVGALLQAERQGAFLAEELTSRYEEIDLLYAISEILGQTVRLEEATQTIAREVSTVVGARRASIMVFDESAGVLRTVAARGFGLDGLAPVPVDDECSVAARVYRERRVVVFDPTEPVASPADCGEVRGYRGQAFLSVPICYGASGSPLRCVGVINLTDRLGGDRFTPSDRKLVTAVANQIGAAVENARLVERDLVQQRLRRELELAHDLQLKLLPSPAVLQGDAEVAARCYPADSVGGDFYTFSRLGRGRVGVMLGDVASHGFSAALVMALVMSAAGIHAAASVTPDEALTALLDSLGPELASTEMYFSVFYGVLDPLTGRLSYSNAGHPYAFRVPRFGDPERLEATAPPLGLATAGSIQRRQVPWSIDHDLLVLWTDGLVDARNAAGEAFGEQRLLDAVCSRRTEPPESIVRAVLEEAEAFGAEPADDRTLLIMRI
jgi:sigma-B regulation protein RsbU (phosphoserine phosphatase)